MADSEISRQDLSDLRQAKSLLEQPSLASRITAAIGTPIEQGFDLLPESWSDTVHGAVQGSLNRALEFAVRSMGEGRGAPARLGRHRFAVIATGAAGGAFGLPGLLVELPVSTTLMLRSIADIARSEGEDVQEINVQLACLEVFALGGPSEADDAAETGYFAVRAALAQSITEASRHLAERGLIERGAPALVRFISNVASRFGVVVSEKVAAAAVPAVGALGGAAVNSMFINHFQNMARGHFTVRRLEAKYGQPAVKAAYETLPPA